MKGDEIALLWQQFGTGCRDHYGGSMRNGYRRYDATFSQQGSQVIEFMPVRGVLYHTIVAAAAMLSSRAEANREARSRQHCVEGRQTLPAGEVQQQVELLRADATDRLRWVR